MSYPEYNEAYYDTFIQENTKEFFDLIQNNEINGINRFSFQFGDSHQILDEAPEFCENLMEIYMNTKDPTTLPRSIELRRKRDFIERYRPTYVPRDLREVIPFLELINEQNFKKQYYTDGFGNAKDHTHFFKKIYEIKTKNEFVIRLGVEYGNRRYHDVNGDGIFKDEENLFKSAKMTLLLAE
uniref:Uncharacterized protein n=1 Tax=Acrobeloides nanus TaxID=290746 RepID=A0A914E0V6_9BILA